MIDAGDMKPGAHIPSEAPPTSHKEIQKARRSHYAGSWDGGGWVASRPPPSLDSTERRLAPRTARHDDQFDGVQRGNARSFQVLHDALIAYGVRHPTGFVLNTIEFVTHGSAPRPSTTRAVPMGYRMTQDTVRTMGLPRRGIGLHVVEGITERIGIRLAIIRPTPLRHRVVIPQGTQVISGFFRKIRTGPPVPRLPIGMAGLGRVVIDAEASLA